jgi:hypothetical protein
MTERNQCDGCAVNAPLTERGNHKMPDGGFMGCTKSKYDSPVAIGHPIADPAPTPAAAQTVRVCAISDIECSRGCGVGDCRREREARYPVERPAAAQFNQTALAELYAFQELTGCDTADEYRAKLATAAQDESDDHE